jgi:hypothetical protein
LQDQRIVAEERSWIDLGTAKHFRTPAAAAAANVAQTVAQAPGQSIAVVCQDWANKRPTDF